jgi:alpha-ketoglutarate-dependent taurine dioxygenase
MRAESTPDAPCPWAHPGYRIGWLSPGGRLPLLVEPRERQPLSAVDGALRRLLDQALLDVGAVLLRSFAVPSPIELREFAAGFGAPLARYEFGSTPRSKVLPGIYSSTEYPAHQSIPLHNEQSYTRQWPARLWFHCMRAAETGGETPLADSRLVFRRVPGPIRDAFTRRGLLYVRNYGAALDVPWQRVFGADDPRAVERYCDAQGIEWQWKADGGLRTRQRCQAAARHPTTGEEVWFNQAHLFHISAVEPAIRESLLALGEAELPRNVYFGDGAPIDDASLEAIRAVYREAAVAFPWRAGDVLMLDNLLVAHGRNPFTGDRRVVVAMA